MIAPWTPLTQNSVLQNVLCCDSTLTTTYTELCLTKFTVQLYTGFCYKIYFATTWQPLTQNSSVAKFTVQHHDNHLHTTCATKFSMQNVLCNSLTTTRIKVCVKSFTVQQLDNLLHRALLQNLLYNNLATTCTKLCYKIYNAAPWQPRTQNYVLQNVLCSTLTTTSVLAQICYKIYCATTWQPLAQSSVLHLLCNNLTTTCLELCVKKVTVQQLDNH